MASSEDQLRSRVYSFYSKNIDLKKSFTVQHFMREGVPRSTLYDIVKRYDNDFPPKRRPRSGRNPKIFTKTEINRLVATFDQKEGISTRNAARKFKCSQSMIRYVLKTRTSIRHRKKTAIPDRTQRAKRTSQKPNAGA
jgi:hypothetical protein